jgi:hypothetical protein
MKSTLVQKVFEGLEKKELPIPTFINDYNHFMGVDLANQFWELYELHRITLCT